MTVHDGEVTNPDEQTGVSNVLMCTGETVTAAHTPLTTKILGATLVWSVLAASLLLLRPDLVFG